MLFLIFSIYDEAAESLHQLADKLPAPGNLSLKTNLFGVYLVSYWSKNSSSKSIGKSSENVSLIAQLT